MSTMTVPPEVAAYLASVREALDDLPTAERDDLLAEVEDSLVEAVTEGGGPIVARLGQPEEFAAELRAAAGLQERVAAAPKPERVPLRELAARLAADDRVRAARRVIRELAPIWWLARAYVAVAALALLFDASWSTRHPSVPHIPTAEVGLALIAVAVVASIWLGLRTRPGSPRLRQIVLAANLVLVAAILPVASHLTDARQPELIYVSVPSEPLPGLANSGAAVENIYPYSRDGHLLQDVLLYDAAGNPLSVGGEAVPDPSRRVLRTLAGAPIFNSFPIRYYDPGTARVAHPNAGPQVKTPHIATPPPLVAKARAHKARAKARAHKARNSR
jgi:HAAS domain-containing protein